MREPRSSLLVMLGNGRVGRLSWTVLGNRQVWGWGSLILSDSSFSIIELRRNTSHKTHLHSIRSEAVEKNRSILD
jgi:hypothetical protein